MKNCTLLTILSAIVLFAGCEEKKRTIPLEDVVVAFTAPKTSEIGVIFAEDAAKDVAQALSKVLCKSVEVVSEDKVAPTAKTVIYIGDTEAAKEVGIDVKRLNDVEAHLRTRNGKIYIAARTGMGVNNGCIEFLQRYCDYWFVSVWGDADSYAVNPKLAVPEFDFTLKPAFASTSVHGGNLYPNDRRGYKAKMMQSTTWFAKRYPFERRCRTFYVNSEVDGKNRVSDQTPCNHSQFSYLPPEKYFKEHPEWYSMDENGKRRAVANKNSQLCYTNKAALEEIWKNMRAKVIADRKAKPADYPRIYDFTQMDSCHHLCLCPECKKITEKGGDTALQLNLVNELARRMKKEFPDNIIRIFAYVSTGSVAKDGTRPEPNVMIWTCDLYTKCDHERPLGEKPINDGMKKILDDWFAMTSNIEIWDYMIAGPRFNIVYPEVNFKAIAHDSKYFRDNGVKRFFIEHECSSEPCWDLNHFLLGQFYFNPDIDGNMLLDKYCRMFGPAKDEMRAAFDWLIKRMDECGGIGVDAWWPKSVAFRNRETWEEFLKHLEAAYSVVPEGSPKGIVAHLIVETCRELMSNYKMSTDRDAELQRLKKILPNYLECAIKTRLGSQKDIAAYREEILTMVALLDIDFKDKPDCFKGLSSRDEIVLEHHMVNVRYRKTLVDDPKSSVGKVFPSDASNEVVTVSAGVYDGMGKKSLKDFSFKVAKGCDEYKWYKLGVSQITRDTTLWFTKKWIPNFGLGRYWHTCDGVADDNFFEIWVSARRDTPKNLLYIDRVIMRRVPGI